MSSVVGSLIVKLSAHTSQFTKGLSKSSRHAKSTARSISSSFAGIGVAAAKMAIVAGGAAATAIAAMTKKEAEHIDKLAKMARLYGVTTAELSAYQYAVKLTGGQNDAFNMGLQRLTRRSAEAAAGLGESGKAFKEMGIDAKKFVGMGLDSKIKALAHALEGMGAGDRARLMMPLVDSEALRPWLELLSKGNDEIDRIIKQGKKAGAVFSDMDAAKVEAANDAMSRMSANLKGYVTELTIGLAPAIEIAGEKLSEMFESSRSSSGRVFENTSKITDGIIWMSEAARNFYSWILKGEAAMVRMGKGLIKLETMGFFTSKGSAFDAFFTEWANELDRQSKRIGSIDIAGAFASKQKELDDRMKKSTHTLKDTVAALAETTRMESVNKELQTMRDKIAAIGKTWVEVGRQKMLSLKATKKELNEYNELAAMFKERTEAFDLDTQTKAFIDDLNKQISAFGKTAEQVRLEDLIIAGLSPKKEKQIRAMMETIASLAPSPLLSPDFAGAMQKGSAGAYSMIVQHHFGSKEKEELRIARESLKTEKHQAVLQKGMLDKLDNQLAVRNL